VKKSFILLFTLIFILSAVHGAMQDNPAPRVEITGVNATDLPTVVINATVFDSIGQPVRGLSETNFEIVGDLAPQARIVRVENITDDELDISVVLVIDVSSSMEGQPIERAIEAAQLFVDSLGPNDSVAIYTFSHRFNLVQDYTTNKALLNAAIESISAGGRTGLYQAAYNAVDLAAASPSSRRAVILLSDGAEYGGVSQVGRDAALQEARLRGVPFYTIGLGYGIDRTYLQALSEGTNARFVESPTPEELAGIYADLAALLQSQYILTLELDVPADGTEYDLVLQATTPEGTSLDNATLRAPIPVPIIRPPLLPEVINQVTEVTPDIAADQTISEVEVTIGEGGQPQTITEPPFTFIIDPETLTPGTHPLTIAATDEDGDTGSASFDMQIGVLPPRVIVEANLDEPVESVQTVILDISGQTPGASATYRIDDGPSTTVEEAPYAFDIRPMELTPGEHTLTITATNQGGGVTTLEVPFVVAALPPQITINGLTAGQEVDEVTEIEVNVVASQTPVTSIDFMINGTALESISIPPDDIIISRATLDPMAFEPGDKRLTVRAENASGVATTGEILFTVAALPPVTVFQNLSEGEVIEEDRTVGISFISQTPVVRVAYFLDSQALPEQTRAPWDIELNALELGPGDHSLRVVATTANDMQSSATVNFTVGRGPSLTATALVPTNTPSPTPDIPATRTVVAQATQAAEATIAHHTQVAADATATELAFAATGTAESRATGTAFAQAEAEAQDTAAVQATQARQAEINAQGTASFRATLEFRATQNAERRSTAEAQAALSAQVTATAEAEASRIAGTEVALAATESSVTQSAVQTAQAAATATDVVQATVTGEAAQTATAEAQQTATSEAQAAATQAAGATATQMIAAQIVATATGEAQQQATATAEALEAQAARETATAQSAATSTAEARQTQAAERQATATQEARLTQTAQAEQATQTAEAQVRQTATRQAQLIATVTRIAQLEATETAQAEATMTQDARETLVAQAEINAQGTASAQETRAARMAQATATQNARQTMTAEAQIELDATATAERAEEESAAATRAAQEATQNAQATANAQATIDTQLTAIATEEVEPTTIAQAPTEGAPEPTQAAPTATPRGTLVPMEVESETADVNQLIPILVVIVVAVVILLVIYLILRGGRNTRR